MFRCVYTDSKGTLSFIIRKPEDADKLFTILSDIKPVMFEHEGTIHPASVARSKTKAIIDFMQMK